MFVKTVFRATAATVSDQSGTDLRFQTAGVAAIERDSSQGFEEPRHSGRSFDRLLELDKRARAGDADLLESCAQVGAAS